MRCVVRKASDGFGVARLVASHAVAGVLRKAVAEAPRIVGAARKYRVNPVVAATRYWGLYRERRFSPNEIHFLRLLDPAVDLTTVISKEELLAVQHRLNPKALHALTEDKLAFHRHCVEAKLPVPRIFAIHDASDPGNEHFTMLRDANDWTRFLDDPPAPAFILKPVDGVHGEGVVRFSRTGEGWQNHAGVPVTARDILAHIAAWDYRRWIVQALVIGNAQLRELSGASGLQTIRVVTITEDNGDVTVVAARLRLIAGDSAHDNFDYGRTGNLIANLDVATGEIRSVIGGSGDPCAITQVTKHPRTGAPLIGYRVPQWPQARDLVQRAARAFVPLRTIGWDVAITDDQPCLIEANVTWDTLTGEPRMGDIYRRMMDLAERDGQHRAGATADAGNVRPS